MHQNTCSSNRAHTISDIFKGTEGGLSLKFDDGRPCGRAVFHTPERDENPENHEWQRWWCAMWELHLMAWHNEDRGEDLGQTTSVLEAVKVHGLAPILGFSSRECGYRREMVLMWKIFPPYFQLNFFPAPIRHKVHHYVMMCMDRGRVIYFQERKWQLGHCEVHQIVIIIFKWTQCVEFGVNIAHVLFFHDIFFS